MYAIDLNLNIEIKSNDSRNTATNNDNARISKVVCFNYDLRVRLADSLL